MGVASNQITAVPNLPADGDASGSTNDATSGRQTLLLLFWNPVCSLCHAQSTCTATARFSTARYEVSCKERCAADCDSIAWAPAELPSQLGNGFCEEECAVPSCEFDGGDCVAP